MEDFKEVLTYCELRDLGFRRNSFTWCNNRDGDQWNLETLDRFLVKSPWCFMFPNGGMCHSFATYSDHCLIVLNTKKFIYRSKDTKLFQFETMWIGDVTCSHIIEQIRDECENRVSFKGVMRLSSSCTAKLQ